MSEPGKFRRGLAATQFRDYKRVEDKFKVRFHFATLYHSWERGTNENSNGRIRQHPLKGTCMKSLTQGECERTPSELNERPRERLSF